MEAETLIAIAVILFLSFLGRRKQRTKLLEEEWMHLIFQQARRAHDQYHNYFTGLSLGN